LQNRGRLGAVALMCLVLVAMSASLASASTLTDIPGRLADTLDVSQTTAELIISVAILSAITLAMSAARAPVIGIVIILLAVMGLLTAMGWIDVWLMVLAALFAAGLWATIFSGILGGSSEG
jgi:hypothetical protein